MCWLSSVIVERRPMFIVPCEMKNEVDGLFFFFQAEDGIRDLTVTGVQTCALPIYIRARLVPTADSIPSIFYNVKYNSDGKIQFQQTWSVGVASTPLRIRDVRVSV